MAAVLTIGGTQYTMIEDQFDLTNSLGERQRLKVDVIDYAGTAHFVKGGVVMVTDPVLGVLFSGYLNSDKEVIQYSSNAILHSIDCIGQHWLADKRTYTRVYDTAQPAGKIAVDHLNDVLVPEGINQNFALDYDTTANDFNQGILSGTIGTSNVGDGDLELTRAGSNVSITESTTADFAPGTLTNVTATNNTLVPATVSGLQFIATLPTPQSTAYFSLFIWSGSQALGTNDTLNYDIWISGSSPQIMGAFYFLFTDGTTSGGLVDSNGNQANSIADMSNLAKDKWYTRSCSTTNWNGKTIQSLVWKFGGTSQGTYTAYVKNVYLGSGTVFFATNAAATQLNPPTIWTYLWYDPSSIITSVLPVMNPVTSLRTSPSHSIDAVKLLSSSTVVWNASTPNNSAFILKVSYDGGSSYTTCTNNSALPALPAGSNIAGLSTILQESFYVGNNPTTLPILQDVAINLISAPNATKSDIVTNYISQAQWNTGTYTYLTATSGGDLTLGTLTRNWNDNLITNQTAFLASTNISESATGGQYTMTATAVGSTTAGYGTSRLDFCGLQILNFTLDVDMTMGDASGDVGVTFRTTSWTVENNTFAYCVTFGSNTMSLFIGNNGSPGGITTLATAAHTINANTQYHLRLVVNGLNFQCYFNNEGTPSINFTGVPANSWTQPGGIGLRMFNHLSGTQTVKWDNLAFSPSPFGTWISPAISLASLGTCGFSSIFWTQLNAANPQVAYVLVQTSVDGGSTYQTATSNGSIPNLPSGTNVSSKTLIVKVFMSAIDTTINLPLVRQLVWRVLGAFPTVSGTRSTIPIGNDTMVRANVGSGWGTSIDGQAWAQVGTGTTNLTSNEGQIINTTGDVHMVLGSRAWTDEDATVRFSLSASTINGGMELRYVDTNNFYRLVTSTTALSIIKKQAGVTVTLATASITLTPNTFYRMRFRVTGSGAVSLFGKVWPDGVIEPGVSNGVMSVTSPQWNVTAAD